jgi:deoxyribodipyrimidine photolyase
MTSPWIHAGSLSVRAVYYAVAARHAAWCAEGAGRARSCLEFLQQLGYREYRCVLCCAVCCVCCVC